MNQKTLVPIGVDWADSKHDFYLISPGREPLAGTFKQDPSQIEMIITRWREEHPGATFAVAIEATKGR